jgi:hypothetical protein
MLTVALATLLGGVAASPVFLRRLAMRGTVLLLLLRLCSCLLLLLAYLLNG